MCSSDLWHCPYRQCHGILDFYFEKIRVFKAGILRLNKLAWNNKIGCRFYFVGFCRVDIMIDWDGQGHLYLIVRGEILGFVKDKLLRKHLTGMFSSNQERK